jgi:hypothetical protein
MIHISGESCSGDAAENSHGSEKESTVTYLQVVPVLDCFVPMNGYRLLPERALYERRLLIFLDFAFFASTAESAVFFFLFGGGGGLGDGSLRLTVGGTWRIASTL